MLPKHPFIIFLILIIFTQASRAPGGNPNPNRDRLFDLGWKFKLGEYYYGAERAKYNDADWRVLDLPHDWSIGDLANQDGVNVIGPFSKESPGGLATGNTIGGTGWYRKSFVLDSADIGKTVYIRFDGVYMESEVWVNGHRLGHHPNGYMPFCYDITSSLYAPGDTNVVSVRVQNIGLNSRWYSGSGIYRHVWLTVVHPIHVAVWGTYITTPEIAREQAAVNPEITLNNNSEQNALITVQTRILNHQGKAIAYSEQPVEVDEHNSKTCQQKMVIQSPQLWSPESPYLYQAEVTLVQEGQIIDRYNTPFGIREIEFSAEKGFRLNGQPVELKGACMHHDNGLLGAAAFDRADERRIEIMKANGYNAIRTSHNPPSQQFLDACDRLGMLVLDEAYDSWEWSKQPQGVHRFFDAWWQRELAAMISRDRNHPGIIMWSIGNEIRERAMPQGLKIAKELTGFIKRMDPTRPVTNAICAFWDNPGTKWSATAPAFEILDVGGYNYLPEFYEPDHAIFPQRIMMGTESTAKAALQYWRLVEKHPYVIGDFIWTGMDYLGEAGLGHSLYGPIDSGFVYCRPWPWYNAWCGDIDLIGNKKPQSYYRDVVWGRSQLEMAVHEPVSDGMVETVSMWGWPLEYRHWNWAGEEGTPLQVSVYSTCPVIRLELNGKMIGEQKINLDTTITAKFMVPYKPGEIKAIGYKNGKEVVSKILKTTGAAQAIRLSVDRPKIKADRNDLAFVSVAVIDESGLVVPTAKIPIQFKINGEGELIAAGNACPNEPAGFQQPGCTTFEGRALAIIRPTINHGTIELIAESEGLKSSRIMIETVGKKRKLHKTRGKTLN